MAREADIERLVKGVGDLLVGVLDPRGRVAGEVALESAVRAVLVRLMEEARADETVASRGPAEVLDYCATVLRRVRHYVLEAVDKSPKDAEPGAAGRLF